MKDSIVATHQREVEIPVPLASICETLASRQRASVWLDGRGGFDDTWATGSLLALDPRVSMVFPGRGCDGLQRALARVESTVRRRRRRGGSAGTGVVLLLAYEALDDERPVGTAARGVPRIVVVEIDRSLRLIDGTRFLLTENRNAAGRQAAGGADDAFVQRLVEQTTGRGARQVRPARVSGRVRSSLGHNEYVRAVERIQRHIVRGDVYQANLCQHFTAAYRGDEWRLFEALEHATPAPRSAFVRTPAFCVASVSPEIFLRGGPDDRIETWPIKGTRSRRTDPASDADAARELLASPKDRAELLMIVDLERNDLGRVCRVGTISVKHLATLRSFAAVHHLIACVEGRLLGGAGICEILRATFPGGSISGAPKIRARQILRDVEGVSRGFFTGALCWLGDDGAYDSSVLIRTLVFAGGHVRLGAGGGIVADSDPEQEWHESNLKARALAHALGFAPEEAG